MSLFDTERLDRNIHTIWTHSLQKFKQLAFRGKDRGSIVRDDRFVELRDAGELIEGHRLLAAHKKIYPLIWPNPNLSRIS